VITFVSLFLGLVSGPQIVEIAVAERVATVELRLDGKVVAVLSGKPWKAEVDFGPDLRTHELVAVARDGVGAQVGRARQQINVPRPAAEAEILLEGWHGGRPRTARLIWTSRQFLEPESIRVALDGRDLEVEDPGRIELPPVDPQSMHFITAELTFAANQRSTAQSIFGGRYGEKAESELTAVPVLLKRRRLEQPEESSGWLRRPSGEPLRVVAIEDDPAQLFIVRDDDALPTLRQLDRALRSDRGYGYRRLGLEAEDRLFLMSARAVVTAHPDLDYQLYPISRAFGLEDVALPEALSRFRVEVEATTEQRFSDAVAVAGVRAAAEGRRRAVLLIVSRCGEQSGHWTGNGVRQYLAELRVPLEVWTTQWPNPDNGGFCRGARHLINTESYGGALSRLRRLLKRQQILWVEGSHLPREIVLAENAPATEVVQQN
jgi:hypothetical protein